MGSQEGESDAPGGFGFRTTDLAAIADGEYLPEKSTTVPVGLSAAYSDIISDLVTVEKENHALHSIAIEGEVNVAGRATDISDVVGDGFERLATNILVEVNSQWRSIDPDRLIIASAGGQVVGKYLLPVLSQAELADEPITAKYAGYWAWGNRLWQIL
ncbi:MAG: hypothetical protein R6U70_06870 [Bacillota bacterium]